MLAYRRARLAGQKERQRIPSDSNGVLKKKNLFIIIPRRDFHAIFFSIHQNAWNWYHWTTGIMEMHQTEEIVSRNRTNHV